MVDPQRDVEQYMEEAAAQGLKITHVLETHLHADFVSGHRELADLTGAVIVFGEKAHAEFPNHAVSDGDVVKIGGISLHILESPGHTPEGNLLGGWSLERFIAQVGRPREVVSRRLQSGCVQLPFLLRAVEFRSCRSDKDESCSPDHSP